jgi:hypothetical protein
MKSTLVWYQTHLIYAVSVADPDDFWLDPDPDPNKFSANFFLDFFFMKICLKSIFMKQKVKYIWALKHSQKSRYLGIY